MASIIIVLDFRSLYNSNLVSIVRNHEESRCPGAEHRGHSFFLKSPKHSSLFTVTNLVWHQADLQYPPLTLSIDWVEVID